MPLYSLMHDVPVKRWTVSVHMYVYTFLPFLPHFVDYTPGELQWAVSPPAKVITGKRVSECLPTDVYREAGMEYLYNA